MKKFFILFFVIALSILLVNIPKAKAASVTFYSKIKSPKYSSSYNPTNYTHIGYYSNQDQSGNKRWIIYSDVYVRNYYKISYVGILGSPQATYTKPLVFLEQISIDKLSFFMSEELVHTNSLTLEMTINVNDIKNGFGVTWNKVTRYSQGVKISSYVDENYAEAPLVALVVYKVEASVREVVHEGISTRSWLLGSWSSYQWTTRSKSQQWCTIGYVGYFTYLGDGNDTDYLNSYYLINNHPDFYDPNLYRSY